MHELSSKQAFKSHIESWTEELLAGYVAALERRSPGSTAAKEINDPVWGTVVLRPLEVLVLDSPLLQRLRYIRQLGVIHLIYPGANHTRLEHTIGVVHQVNRLVESLNEHYEGDEAAIDDASRHLLRLTALVHDTGHGVMSHVSENALHNFEVVQQIQADFADSVEAEELPLAEIAAYYMVGSDAFARLLKLGQELAEDHDLPRDPAQKIQRMIIGRAVDNRVPLLHELISGPFDGDKLDYMTRDAMMTGVPVVTDIPRLVQKVRAVRLPQRELPDKVSHEVTAGAPYYVMTGISLSGGRTLDELMFGQVLLHDKLYRHQKVRAAEAMVASIFRQIAELVDGGPAMAAYRLLDHDVLSLDSARLQTLVDRQLDGEELAKAEVALDLSRRLRQRDLFVRAYAFAQDMPLDHYHSDPEHYDGLERLVAQADDIEFRGELVGAIAAELQSIGQLIAPELMERYGGNLKPYLWLDPPPPPPDPTDSLHAYLIAERPDRREVLSYSEGIAGTSRWSDAYLLTREIGYLFTAADLAPHAFIATEAVLRERYAVRTPASMYIYSKQAPETVRELKRELAAAGYYDGKPFDLRPMPQRLTRVDVANRVDRVLAQLRTYEGPVGARAEAGEPLLGEQRILDWLRQFPEHLVDGALRITEGIRMVGRHEVVRALGEFMNSHGDQFAGAAVCPLGTAKDSAAIMAYYANDLRGLHGLEVLSVPEALAQERPIVFIDDFVGSGAQSISIIEAWMGVDPTTDLDEERGLPLSETARAGLRARDLGFVFAAGMPDGAQALSEALQRLDLRGLVHLTHDPLAPQAFRGGQDLELRDECQRIGLQLLDDGDARHDEAWRDKRALGYGNQGFLVTFPYNTPTQTLTCVWKSGRVDGVQWTPLLLRRPKL